MSSLDQQSRLVIQFFPAVLITHLKAAIGTQHLRGSCIRVHEMLFTMDSHWWRQRRQTAHHSKVFQVWVWRREAATEDNPRRSLLSGLWSSFRDCEPATTGCRNLSDRQLCRVPTIFLRQRGDFDLRYHVRAKLNGAQHNCLPKRATLKLLSTPQYYEKIWI